MSGINFLSENYVNEATLSLTTGTENAQFPLSNIQNVSTTNKFRSTGNSVVIEIDLQQTRPIDSFAIAGDASGLFGLTSVSIKTSVTNDFTGSTSIPIPLYSEQSIGWAFITEVSHRYVEVTLTGTGSFAEVGAIFVGQRINLPLNSFSIGSFRYGYEDVSSVRANRYGTKFIDQLPLRKNLSGTIQYATKEEQETLDDMFIFHGRTKPLWVILDPSSDAINDGASKLTMYSFIESMPVWTADGGQIYTAQVRLEQAI